MDIFGFTQYDAIAMIARFFFFGMLLGHIMGLIRYMIWGVNEPAFKL